MKRITAVLTAVLLGAALTVTASAYSRGDVNHDGQIKANDARLVLRYSAELDAGGTFDLSLADMDGDGFIRANDARRILRIAADIEPVLPDTETTEQITEEIATTEITSAETTAETETASQKADETETTSEYVTEVNTTESVTSEKTTAERETTTAKETTTIAETTTEEQTTEPPAAVHVHEWDFGVPVTPATCTADGIKAYTCRICGAKKEEKIGKHGHSNSGNEDVIENYIPAAKGKEGSYDIVKYCLECGKEYERETITFTTHEHSWNEGKVVQQMDCRNNEITEYVCSVCGESKTEMQPTDGKHDFRYEYAKDIVLPDETSSGRYTSVYVCVGCGGTKEENVSLAPLSLYYTVNFDSDGGEGYMSPICVNRDTVFPVPSCSFRKTVKVTFVDGQQISSKEAETPFAYWQLVCDADDPDNCASDEWADEKITAYRKVDNLALCEWTEVTLKARYDSAEISLPEPSRKGKTFLGWYTGDGSRAENSIRINDDTVLYAKWN